MESAAAFSGSCEEPLEDSVTCLLYCYRKYPSQLSICTDYTFMINYVKCGEKVRTV